MTTATKQAPRVTGTRPLVGAALAALGVGALVVLAAAVFGGSDAATAALIGTLITAVVFVLGSFSVNLVAALLPAASLLVALLTYVLQVVVMALAFVALSDSPLLDTTVARTWLAVAVIAVTATWLVAQIWLTTHLRIPAYDLPPEGAPEGRTGGER